MPVEDSVQETVWNEYGGAPTFPNLSHLETNLPHDIAAALILSSVMGSPRLRCVKVAHCGEETCPFNQFRLNVSNSNQTNAMSKSQSASDEWLVSRTSDDLNDREVDIDEDGASDEDRDTECDSDDTIDSDSDDDISGECSLPWSDIAAFKSNLGKLPSLKTLVLETWSVWSSLEQQRQLAEEIACGNNLDAVEVVWGVPAGSHNRVCIDRRSEKL
ncbi:hypothetical protein AAF712_012400 [Marasmius tenuissimus]|uniref:Uncharacterized protein n=1 Tax=Marasmius tenuissimus TaxID=585030 RepID=A0ABR2ZK21_9AGAR